MKRTTNISPFTPATKAAAVDAKKYEKIKVSDHKVNSVNS